MNTRIMAVALVCGGFMAIAGQPPTTWYVDDDCVAPGSGTQADPFCLIQDCIVAATGGNECVVAPGTYFETINFLGKAIRVYSTDGPDVTIIDAQGSGSVVTCNSTEGSNTILDGFTITGGTGTDPGDGFLRGGGMYVFQSSPTVINCTFNTNSADVGGGMYNGDGSSPTVADCTFSANNANSGGGMRNDPGSIAHISNCNFSANVAEGTGGAMMVHLASPVIEGCLFERNSGHSGGAIKFQGNSQPVPVLKDCVFTANSANAGGAIHNTTTRPRFVRCMFRNNEALSGGAVRAQSGCPIFVGCLLVDNAATFGGALYNVHHADPTLIGCTVGNNSASSAGGAVAALGSSSDTVLVNCVLWGNTSPLGPQVYVDSGVFNTSTITISYSNIEGGLDEIFLGSDDAAVWGAGNIDADPLFVESGFWDDNGTPEDPDDDFWVEGDYHLLPGSPCIDAGDNTAVPEGIVTDLDGNPRFVDDPNTDDTGFGDPPIVDMGAYEFGDPCADDDGDGRITICHIPPGNPDNAHTITVSVNAVPAHLAHGDYCGPCEGGLSADHEAGGIFGVQGEKSTRESVAPVLRERGP